VQVKWSFNSNQLRSMLGVNLKTTWFMSHHICGAMTKDYLAPFSQGDDAVGVNESYIGNDRSIEPIHSKKGRGFQHKYKVLALADRNTGRARSMVVDKINANTLIPLINDAVGKNGCDLKIMKRLRTSPCTSVTRTSSSTKVRASGVVPWFTPNQLSAISACSSVT
jgi:hypothetical protein